MDEATTPANADETSRNDPSIFLVSLHILMWTVLVVGFVMVMVVVMLNA
ncbi:MAG: hypothetical protein IPI49_16410 [Myxococcales bacterium]|jgi:hypothetical protein|nr:hypothetical protein [Myxococcales bacterium]HRC54673.1 hypothetical protein [Kofleriaceae bacterium]